MRARVYIAGPYTAPTEELKLQNVNNAIKVGNELINFKLLKFFKLYKNYIDRDTKNEKM